MTAESGAPDGNVRGKRMEIPNVVHPKTFNINGIFFQVVSYTSLSDEQAEKMAMYFYRKHKFKKKDKGKIIKIITTADSQSANLF